MTAISFTNVFNLALKHIKKTKATEVWNKLIKWSLLLPYKDNPLSRIASGITSIHQIFPASEILSLFVYLNNTKNSQTVSLEAHNTLQKLEKVIPMRIHLKGISTLAVQVDKRAHRWQGREAEGWGGKEILFRDIPRAKSRASRCNQSILNFSSMFCFL